MRSPGYEEKFQRSLEQKTKVEKILNKKDIQDNLYIKNRLKNLAKVKKFVSED